MATNPLRAAWGYLRGDDLKALAPTTFPAAASRIVEEKIAFTTETYPGGAESVIRMGTLVHGPGATEAYARAYGMGDDANSAVFACLERICTTYVKAPLRVWRGDAEGGKPDVMVDHPLEELLATPNDAMTGAELWWWTQWAKEVAGNAYWRKVRAGNADTGNVVQLWPLSPALVVPVTTEEDRRRGVFLSHYRYQYAPGRYEAIAPQNLVHFKLGLADHDHRLGCSPLQRLVRQVATDDEATRFTQTLLTNYAVPGLVYFAGEKDGPLNQDKADALKARITALFSGEGRGRVGVASPGADMKQYGFSPQEMDLKVLHRLPEERIAAVLGVPPGVAGLGAGLDRQIYNNYREAREAFFEQKILPAYQFDAARVDASLLPDFTTQKRVFCRFDTAQLPELAEDQDKKFARVTALLAAGGLTLNQAQLELGLPGFGPDGDVLYLPNKLAPTLPTDLLAAPQPPPLPLLPPANGANGANGQAQITEVPPGGKRLQLVTTPQETKRRPASDVVRAALLRLKARLVPPCADDLAAYLRDERDQTAASVRVLGLAAGSTLFSRAGELRTLLALHQRRALRSVQVVTEDALGVTLELDAAAAVRALGDVAHSVEAHTHDAIRQALAAGDAAGETAGPLAVRVAALPVFGEARAQEIARTELARAVNLAALRAYEAAGVPAVRIDDSSDDPACAAEAGRELPLGEAAAVPLVGHPNCSRLFLPAGVAANAEDAA
jgi:HK97 family phage portal protein